MTEVEEQALVALTPAEMVPAQQHLLDWCGRKIATLKVEQKELEEHAHIARANGWKLSALTAALNRTARRITYYENMRVAVGEGFLMVPNMPIDVLAVRVNREKPPETISNSSWGFEATPQANLPAGEGRYVDDQVVYRDESHTTMVNGKEQLVRRFVADDYDEVDLPFRGVKPVVLDATARAMALKVFDRIGVVRNGGRDPIIVGQLLDPRGNRRMATFFIAWYVNTADL